MRKSPLLPALRVLGPVAIAEALEDGKRDVRMRVAREKHESGLARHTAVGPVPHLLDRDFDQPFDVVVHLAPVVPREVPSAALAVIPRVAGKELVQCEKVHEVSGVHHILAAARVWSPRLAAPVVLRHRIRPCVAAYHAPQAVSEHLADALAKVLVAAHPDCGGGVSGKRHAVALGEDSVLRAADVPPLLLLFLRKRARDALKPCNGGEFVARHGERLRPLDHRRRGLKHLLRRQSAGTQRHPCRECERDEQEEKSNADFTMPSASSRDEEQP